ncbi:DUF7382 domain-containing protein [Halopiger aswanensis]|uniref:DUF7382 domain-containing protein n=1 Tax=Halopiger aswanensis TaxID=148449 RepID=A0A3R7FXH9_9EURY|nr:hypothetical protein [Halopiger aswanensis]RKD97457.1 hypothetical protein ATJ93_0443 [Halopiger aswanensis]
MASGRESPSPTVSISVGSRRSFADDDRAIEGLPIRLVIALIIGVVSLGIMLQILGGIDGFQTDTEVDVRFDDATIKEDDDDVSIYVVDEDGNEVTDAVVVAQAGTARMDGALSDDTGDNNEVEFDFDSEGDLSLAPDQSTGTIEFTVQPPADSNWEDAEPNNELLVVDD